MKNLNPRIERLKQMMVLEEKRATLQGELDSLLGQLSVLKDQLLDEASTGHAGVPRATATKTAARSAGGTKRTPRGLLRDQIMAALEAAGGAGVKVKELAAAIGTKPVNVHSWFHSALKRNAPIKKLIGGHYRLSSAPGTAVAPAEKEIKTQKAAARPATKAGKSKRGGAKRGQLSEQILNELKAAGAGGVTVADLAAKLGAKYKNIYIWFATTGKKNSSVKKVGPAKYKLTA